MDSEGCHVYEVLLPLMCNYLPEDFKVKLQKDFNETEENKEKGLKILRDCIQCDKLPLSTEDNFLLHFLRWAKYDFMKAKEKLKCYVKFQEKFTASLRTTSMARIAAVVDHQFFGVLPYRDRNGSIVSYTRGRAWNKKVFDMNDVSVCSMGFGLFLLGLPLSSVSGVCYIDDAAVHSVFDLYPMFKIFLEFVPVLTLLPFRYKRVDVINENPLCHWFAKIIKPVLPAKLRNRFFLHGNDLEALNKVYPPSMLPLEFGGTKGCLSPDAYRDQFLDFLKNLMDESNKTQKP